MDLQSLANGLGAAVAAFQAPSGVPQQALSLLGPWLRQLAEAAPGKWLPILAQDIQCAVPVSRQLVDLGADPECQNAAVALCSVCQRPTCLQHALISAQAECICFVCASAAKQLHQQQLHQQKAPSGRSRRQERRQHRRPPQDDHASIQREAYEQACQTLGVAPGASDAEVKSAYRRKMAENHPDRHGGDPSKNEVCHRIQRDFEFIRKYREENEP